ncbi:MAG: type I restriction endonuclease subunit R [Candidatus Cryptobacteroides sp.]
MSSTFNEATRVQMPAMVHLTRLGYSYFGKISEDKKGVVYDGDTNILIQVFKSQFERLNPNHKNEFEQVFQDIKRELDNNDLGEAFYKRIKSVSPTKLIDFENISNNTFHFTSEFTCKNENEEFRPDITLFVNGLPLVYIEVKKPNNKEGIVAERNREYNQRFPNKKFRRFNNITQFMIFSNNMEYDTMGGIVPVQGVFYCTNAYKRAPFSCFREENPLNEEVAPYNKRYQYKEIDPREEYQILADFNCQVIKNHEEYKTNVGINRPTNRLLTSMCSPERLLYILRYSLAYVHKQRELKDGTIEKIDEKHIMRYQQLFATYAITDSLSNGIKSGLIWHTQGSGKTALAYYLTNILTDYYAKKDTVAQFFFIVDRIDLLDQATKEFKARGLKVSTADTKEDLLELLRKPQSAQGNTGEKEMIVVNIQRFSNDNKKVQLPEYAIKRQRIFIIDEAHRGYKPTGCFLANLFDADRDSVKLALTGTPLIGEERNSCSVFGNYIHTYYYDKSIQDGYTLKILREDIETSWKNKLQEAMSGLDKLVEKKELSKNDIISHDSYARPLIRYIIEDLIKFRQNRGDNTLGGMVICETSGQARKLFSLFDQTVYEYNRNASQKVNLRAGLILYDSDDKDTRKQVVEDFKENMTVDILIVYNMLLTGFDAPRLKRLYFGRKLKDHNLLQAITRVNRPYKDNRYGYLIDFADIKQNFEQTNEAYLKELMRFNNPDEVGIDNITDTFTQVLENPDKIIADMKEIQDKLFNYATDNVEDFTTQISTIEDKQELLELKKVVTAARDMANLVRSFGSEEFKEKFAQVDLPKLPLMLGELNRRIDLINIKERFNPDEKTQQIITDALANIEFRFNLVKTEEMKLISGGEELKDKYKRAIHSFTSYFDPDDPEYITLQELFIKRFKEHNFVIDSLAKFNEETKAMDEIIQRLQSLYNANKVLLKKYNDDVKFARVHKRIREENEQRSKKSESPIISSSETEIYKTLFFIKGMVDGQVYDRNDILKKDAYFESTVMNIITNSLNNLQIANKRSDRQFIQSRISKQYLDQYHAQYN